MKFIVDAQLPRSLATLRRDRGHDVVHTTDLPNGNDTSDAEVNRLSLSDERIVISKDGDFYNNFAAKKEPYKLLHVKMGNTSNEALMALFEKNLNAILRGLDEGFVVEISQHYIITIQ